MDSALHAHESGLNIKRKEWIDLLWMQIESKWPSDELGRVKECFENWRNPSRPTPYNYQAAKGIYFPGLPDKPWLDPGEFACAAILQDNYSIITQEAMQFMEGQISAPPYGLDDYAKGDDSPVEGRPAGWREWRLLSRNRLLEHRCSQFPMTTAVIRHISTTTPFLMNAIFMIMRSGASLQPHCDFNNVFVSLWLPLIVPQNCAIEVAGITKAPEVGKCLAFSHSYKHSSWNFGDTDRIVLNISHLHPALTAVEQEVIAFLFGYRRRVVIYERRFGQREGVTQNPPKV
jgi:aspartyl/asparaginyl beta-hydroxylase (cupin superfamily)